MNIVYRPKRVAWLVAAIMCATMSFGNIARAGSVSIQLPADNSRFANGQNVELVKETCRECHSADYVTSQPHQSRVGWQNVVTKMITKFGMDPISTTEQALIVDYLVTVYGSP